MDTQSLWMTANYNPKTYPTLSEELEVDVAIIGGGITGMTAALNLIDAGKKVAILEANAVGSGTTGNSTGNLYVGIQPYYQNVLTKFDEKTVGIVADSRKSAIDFIENVVNDYKIPCHFSRRPWFIFANTDQELEKLNKEVSVLKKVNQSISYVSELPFSLSFKKAAVMENQARLNPLKYVQGLAENLEKKGCLIYENSRVLEFSEEEHCFVKTENGKIKAKNIIIATHTPIGINKFNFLTAPYRSYAVAAYRKDNHYPEGHFWDLEQPHHVTCTHSVNTANPEFIIISGSHHKTGQDRDMKLHFEQLEKYLKKHYDISEVYARWSAQHYHAADSLPYIGLANHFSKHTYIATGFFADGLIYGTLAGILLADELQKKDNYCKQAYNSNRIKPIASSGFCIKESFNLFIQYLKDLPLIKTQNVNNIKAGSAKLVNINNEKFAAYRDEQDKLHIVSAVCTHMKCIVNWNNAEKTWDCPCHGSRFSIEGKVLEGPAMMDLKPYTEKNEEERGSIK